MSSQSEAGAGTTVRPKTAPNCSATRPRTIPRSGAAPSSRSAEVTPRSPMPHGSINSKWTEVRRDVEREAVHGDSVADGHANRRDLPPSANTPRLPWSRRAVMRAPPAFESASLRGARRRLGRRERWHATGQSGTRRSAPARGRSPGRPDCLVDADAALGELTVRQEHVVAAAPPPSVTTGGCSTSSSRSGIRSASRSASRRRCSW